MVARRSVGVTSSSMLGLEAAAGLCRRNAVHVVRLAWRSDPRVGFDTQGVRWLDNYLEASRTSLSADLRPEFEQLMGCFYGECLIATFDGTWEVHGDTLAVRTAHGLTYPFAAISRQLTDGPGASVAEAYLTAVEYLAGAA